VAYFQEQAAKRAKGMLCVAFCSLASKYGRITAEVASLPTFKGKKYKLPLLYESNVPL
jgi:hypothetical protein